MNKYEHIIQKCKEVNELTKKSVFDLSYKEFLKIINLSEYDLMDEVLGGLNGTKYPTKGDYTYMNTDQAKAMRWIEWVSDNVRETKNAITIIAREYVKSECLKQYPDKPYLVNWCEVKWGDPDAVYEALHNRVIA